MENEIVSRKRSESASMTLQYLKCEQVCQRYGFKRSTWMGKVKEGKAPQPIHPLGSRLARWSIERLAEWEESMERGN
jgi:predicted DNA-binding transcriptional regulator AlpA